MPTDPRQSQFVSLYVDSQRTIRRVIRLMVQDPKMFDDVVQAVALRLWELFDTYDPDRPFEAWARGVTSRVVRELNRSERRAGPVFSPEAVASILDAFDRNEISGNRPAEQMEMLEQCLRRLSRDDRQLVIQRFHQALPVAEISVQIGKSVENTYKILQSINRRLGECVRRRLLTPAVDLQGPRQ
ncbi:sigma-70 family RNA polymerase sigma factor [Planctomicrobium sp. SH664]|uniref:sigma-70 family RNA polymerase sigma factor n=1 Tax=Planctomicrobium sp. SH664 TaxID=3448125 RepID=UPI003F5C217F